MLLDHWRRLRHQSGKPLRIGERDYRVRGFIANGLATWTHHEPHLRQPIVDALAATSGAFVDVGVNTGQTLMKVLAADPARAYLGFDPQPGCCFFVQRFLLDNDLVNARVICSGLSDENAVVPFYADGVVDEMGSTLATPGKRASGAIVVRRGDEALAELGIDRVGVIKIDVEGLEIRVLNGLARTVDEQRPICFFEVLPHYRGFAPDLWWIDAGAAAANQARADDIWRFFTDRGYRICQIAADGTVGDIAGFDLGDPARHVGNDYVAYAT